MMDEGERQDKVFELRYWQQISNDLGAIGVHVGEIGEETTTAIEKDPWPLLGAGDLLTAVCGHVEAIGDLVLGLQDLVSGRLVALEKRIADLDT